MAGIFPEARSLATWEDAFQHALPVVRKAEQQLRRNIEEHRQKLRSLVGASYRDLLGTAERIIEMDEQIQQAEGHFGDVGRKCNARMAERVQQNHLRMRKDRTAEEQKKYGRLVQIRMLQSALAVTFRIIRTGGDALLASKVLVLARLLHNNVVVNDTEPTAAAEDLAKRSRLARKRLLSYIERSLNRPDADRTHTVHSLCAYSLITSSAPREVLRYFLQVRFAQLEAKTTETIPVESDLLDALKLFRRTLADTKDLFPRRFSDALSQVSEAAVVQDQGVCAVDELSLDIHEQWIAEDVRNFKPWTRYEQFSLLEVKDALASWTKQAQACLLKGIRDNLEQQDDPELVLTFRHKVLLQYLSFRITFRDDAHVHAMNDVRIAFVARLERILQNFAQMAVLSLDLQRTPDTSEIDFSIDSWSLASDHFDLSRGATGFRKAVLRREHGRSDTVQQVADLLDGWISRIQTGHSIVSSMRRTRWDEDVDLDLDELEDGEKVIAALSKQDPQQLSLMLEDTVKQTLRDNYSKLREQSSESSVSAAITIIRTVRELDLRRHVLKAQFANLNSLGFEHNTAEVLHRRLASFVSNTALDQYMQRRRARKHNAIALWDGEPALPVQPSPGIFEFLTVVHRHMSNAGHDLWSPEALRAVKAYIADQLDERHVFSVDDAAPPQQKPLQSGHDGDAASASDNADAAPTNVETVALTQSTTNDARDHAREELMQRTFDVHYLQRILSADGKGSLGLQGTAERFESELQLDGSALARLRKSASDYWRRTCLLFGLLSSHQAAYSNETR